MCFREPCQLQLSQVGPFELGEKADQNPANSIQDVQVGKNPNADTENESISFLFTNID